MSNIVRILQHMMRGTQPPPTAPDRPEITMDEESLRAPLYPQPGPDLLSQTQHMISAGSDIEKAQDAMDTQQMIQHRALAQQARRRRR